MMAGGVEAKDNLCAGRFFQAQALGADGDTAIAADFEGCAHAPDINPPGTARCRTQNGAAFFFGVVPGAL